MTFDWTTEWRASFRGVTLFVKRREDGWFWSAMRSSRLSESDVALTKRDAMEAAVRAAARLERA